jgi:hypothetical protein
VVSLRAEHGRGGVLVPAESGQRWKRHLTSVRVPVQNVAVETFRSSWSVGTRSEGWLGGSSDGEPYAKGQD